MKNEYRKPQQTKIGLEHQKLYDLEDKRDDLIKASAEEQGRILGFTKDQYWTHSLPEQLISILDAFDHKAGEIVCTAFLERSFYKVEAPKEYLVVVPYYWGRANSIEEAKAKTKQQGYSKRFAKHETLIMSFPRGCKPFVNEIGSICWEGKEIEPVTIQEPKVHIKKSN